MTYEEKKRWLWRYRDALRAEEELTQEIEQLQAEATRITPLLSDVPGGGGADNAKLPKAVERIVEAQQRLQYQINCAQAARTEIVDAINGLRNARAREILRRRYLLGERWEQIACVMYMDYRWTLKLHRKILDNLDILE